MSAFDTQKSIGRPGTSHPKPVPSINHMGSTAGAGDEERLIPPTTLYPDPAPLPPFHGPSSSTFLIGLAHLWLDQGFQRVSCPQTDADVAGYEILSVLDNGEDEVNEDNQDEDMAANRPQHIRSEQSSKSGSGRRPPIDPLLELNLDQVTTGILQYDEMIGARFPFLKTEVLIQQAKELYLLVEAKGDDDALAISMDMTSVHILKVLLAIVLVCERTSTRALGYRLFKSSRKAMQEKMWGGVMNTKDLALLILVVRIKLLQLVK
jgi:hypothetical protein